MRSQITSAAAAIAILSLNGPTVDARKPLINESDRVVGTPIVEDCDNICLFKDVSEKNYWCFDFSTPNIKAGW